MRFFIYGRVQGVGFRPTVYRIAKKLGCKGYVRNCGSYVEIVIDRAGREFLRLLQEQLPKLAWIEKIAIVDDDSNSSRYNKSESSVVIEKQHYSEFVILDSTDGIRDTILPPDTALCDTCVNELLYDTNNRRYSYPFTNCTDCGARFSVIYNLPYDRVNTAMNKFELCDSCKHEFNNIDDRRFHAQTISCPVDGPQYTLYNTRGEPVIENNTIVAIERFAQFLDEGKTGVVKGWGGMHICSILEEATNLRKRYRNSDKPFAIMVRDLKTALKYGGKLDDFAIELLLSPARPIVVVERNPAFDELLEPIAPGLNTIGLYMPYSGVHYLLFRELNHDALIMTSANPAGEPMAIHTADAFKLKFDYYLIHNREIVNRVDDSVVRPFRKRTFFIRKSRGYTPSPLNISYSRQIITLGAELNCTASISCKNKLYTTQYIGDTSHYEVLEFLDTSINRYLQLLQIDQIDAIGIDLHPQYTTRKLGIELADKYNTELIEIQHHWAHACSLMLDNNIESTTMAESIICFTWDGTGYGTDGSSWGGEILIADYTQFARVGSLQPLPLIGGDMAVKDPRRLVIAVYELLGLDSTELNYYDREQLEVFRKLLSSTQYYKSSSFGRLLDTVACMLEVCDRRSYDGEPAMKLERYLAEGRKLEKKEVGFSGSSSGGEYEYEPPEVIYRSDGCYYELQTLRLFEQLYYSVLSSKKSSSVLTERTKSLLAYGFVKAVVSKFVELAVELATRYDIRYLGLSGGVTYNIPITELVDECLNEFITNAGSGGSSSNTKLKLLLHNNVPNGDGGISIGQNVIVNSKLM